VRVCVCSARARTLLGTCGQPIVLLLISLALALFRKDFKGDTSNDGLSCSFPPTSAFSLHDCVQLRTRVEVEPTSSLFFPPPLFFYFFFFFPSLSHSSSLSSTSVPPPRVSTRRTNRPRCDLISLYLLITTRALSQGGALHLHFRQRVPQALHRDRQGRHLPFELGDAMLVRLQRLHAGKQDLDHLA